MKVQATWRNRKFLSKFLIIFSDGSRLFLVKLVEIFLPKEKHFFFKQKSWMSTELSILGRKNRHIQLLSVFFFLVPKGVFLLAPQLCLGSRMPWNFKAMANGHVGLEFQGSGSAGSFTVVQEAKPRAVAEVHRMNECIYIYIYLYLVAKMGS